MKRPELILWIISIFLTIILFYFEEGRKNLNFLISAEIVNLFIFSGLFMSLPILLFHTIMRKSKNQNKKLITSSVLGFLPLFFLIALCIIY